ncbi:DUF1992 domain-containing protein [Herbiconiux sp. 11R-BC]|uniref:DnaJ family domain-containing protein n=1 Tax=Herbiconiux sp. 11R-BC TaxID=3111637 RepID=UPI003C024B5A
MSGRRKTSDPRLNVARYRLDGSTPKDADPRGASGTAAGDDDTDAAGRITMDQRTQFVEIQIQQAMRRGDFDDLPGAGKPLRGLGGSYDPDWWIRQKIERENLTGLGPPALTLRTENASLDERLDALHSEPQVREVLDDFNRRVIEARRQLQGGPPVVTPVRDVDAELERWRSRRADRRRAAEAERERADAARAAMTWRERRRARRAERD